MTARLPSVDAQEHDHEQEQDDDGAGVDDDLHGGQEVGRLVDELDGDAEQGHDQHEGAVDRVAQQDHAEGAGQDQGGAGEEHDPRRGVRQVGPGAGGVGEQRGGRQASCNAGSLSASAPPRAGRVPSTPMPRRAPDAISRRDRSVSAAKSAAAGSLWPFWAGRTP